MSRETGLRDSFAVNVQDVSGQKKVRAAGISPDMTVGELVQGLIPQMSLSESDADGRPLSYHLRSDREGRHLREHELAGSVLEPDDVIVLQPNIQAG